MTDEQDIKIIDGVTYISMQEASKLCSYSQEYLSLLARRGRITAKKIGRNWYITKAALDEYLQKQSIVISLPKSFLAQQNFPATLKSEKFGKPVLVSSLTPEEPEDESDDVYQQFLKLNPEVKESVKKPVEALPPQVVQSIQDQTVPAPKLTPPTPSRPSSSEIQIPVNRLAPAVPRQAPSSPLSPASENTSGVNSKADVIIDAISELKQTTVANESREEKIVSTLDKLSDSISLFAQKISEKPAAAVSSAPVFVAPSTQDAPPALTPEQEEFIQVESGSLGYKIKRIGYRASQFPKNPSRITAIVVSAIVFVFLLVGGFTFGNVDTVADQVRKAFKDAQSVDGHFPGTHANEVLVLDKTGKISIFGHIETQGQLRSHAPDGVAPIVVDSMTKVDNLNADYFDNMDSKDFTLAYVTKNGNVTYEDVKLEGNVEVGKTLTLKGALKLMDELNVYGKLGVFADAFFSKDVTLTGGNLNIQKGNITIGQGTINISNPSMIKNLNAELLQGKTPDQITQGITLDRVVSNGNSTDKVAFFNGGLFGANGSFSTLGVSADGSFGSRTNPSNSTFTVYSSKFTIDASGNLTAPGTARFQNLSAPGAILSSLVPSGSFDLGSSGHPWAHIFGSSASFNNLTVSGNLTVTGTASLDSSHTASRSFTINYDNVSSDSEDAYLSFERGTVTPNATLKWNSTANRFELNEPVFISSSSTTTFSVSGGPSSLSNSLFAENGGNVGIGTTAPLAKLQIIGNASVSTNFEASGYASASATFGSGLTNCSVAGTSKLLWDATTGHFSCGTDQNTFSGIGIREGIGAFANKTSISFEANNFNISSPNANEALVKLDWLNGPASRAANETITGNWNFQNGASFTGSFEVVGIASASRFFAQDGTAVLPSYTFSQDQNTGLFRGGTDILSLTAGGLERFRVASETSQFLNVAGSPIVTIASTGNVGIGTDVLNSTLTVKGSTPVTPSAHASVLYVNATSLTTSAAINSYGIYASMSGSSAQYGSAAVYGFNTNSEAIGGGGPTTPGLSYLQGSVGVLGRVNPSTTGNGRWSYGVVGVNEANATNTNIVGTYGAAGMINSQANGRLMGVLGVGYGNTSGPTIAGGVFALNGAGSYTPNITKATALYADAGSIANSRIFEGVSGTTKFVIEGTGNVGIGTTNPLTKLEVIGTASASNLLTVGTLQVANGGATVSYNRFGSNATSHALSANSDVLISGALEVDGPVYFDGGTTFSGTSTTSGNFAVGGQLLLADGSAPAPSLTFTSEPGKDTGLYRIGDDVLGFTTGGIERLRLQNSGASFSAPVEAATFKATTYSGDGALSLLSGGANALTIDTGGSATLTIGGANASVLQIAKSGLTAEFMGDIRVDGNNVRDSANAVRLSLGAVNTITGDLGVTNNASVSGNFEVGTNAFYANPTTKRIGIGTQNLTEAAEIVGNASVSGNGYFAGNVGIGGTTSPGAKLDIGPYQPLSSTVKLIKFTPNDGAVPWDIQQLGHNLSIAGLNVDQGRVMTFAYSGGNGPGNVGIGTTSPGAVLDVVASLSMTSGTILRVASSSGNAYLSIPRSGGVTLDISNDAKQSTRNFISFNGCAGCNGWGIARAGNNFIIRDSGATSGNIMTFAYGVNGSNNFDKIGIGTTAPAALLDVTASATWTTGDLFRVASASPATTLMIIKKSGNVGIGTATPGAKLDVNGSANITGNLSITSNLTAANASISTAFEAKTASASAVFGAAYTGCNSVSQKLLWNSSTGVFFCGTDSGSSGGGGSLEVREYPGGFGAIAATLSFEPGSFNLAGSGSSDVIVRLDWTNGPASRSVNQTISGAWNFTAASNQFGSLLEIGTASIGGNVTIAGTTGTTYTGANAGIVFSGTGTHAIQATGGTLQLNAFTLGGAVTGNSQNITGLGLLTVANASASGNVEFSSNASVGGNLLVVGAATVNGRADFGSNASITGTFESTTAFKAPLFWGDGAVTLKSGGGQSLSLEAPSGALNIAADVNTSSLTLAHTGVVTVLNDDLRILGNDIQDSTSTIRITLGPTVTITGNLAVTGGTLLAQSASVSGNFEVDSGALYVDATRHRVGVGTKNLTSALEIVGNASISGNVAFGGVLQVGSTATASYNRIGTNTTTHALVSPNDLLISGNLEVDGTAYFDASTIIARSVSVSEDFEAVGYASASAFRGGAFSSISNCNTESQTLLWDSTTGKFACGADAGASGGTVRVKEGNTTVVQNSSVITFEPNMFSLTASNSSDTIVRLDWATGPASRSTQNTWSALNIFNAGASVSNNFEVAGTASASRFFAQDGTAVLPSYTFSQDQNTGLFRGGTDILSLTAGGLERFRVASETSQFLNVAGSPIVTIASTGNVGIGTTNPAAKLEVSNTAGGAQILLQLTSSEAAFGNSSSILFKGSGGSTLGRIKNLMESSGVDSFRIAGANDNEYLRLSPDQIGLKNVSGALNATAQLWFSQSGLASASIGVGVPGAGQQYMQFTVNGNEKMRIDNSGNLGIGTNSPDAKLDVTGNILASTSGNVDLTLKSTSNQDAAYTLRTLSTGTFAILGSASNTLVSIASNGNVGIGVTSPVVKLQVAGSASISVNFEASGYSSSSQLFGAGLTSCIGSNKLLWSSGLFSCGIDAGAGSGGFIAIRESGAAFSNKSSLSFEANSFNVSFPTTAEALVKLDWINGPASRAADSTITGFWNFTAASTQLTGLELLNNASIGGNIVTKGTFASSNTGSNSFAGSLDVSKGIRGLDITANGRLLVAGLATFNGGASVTTNFEVVGNNRVGINAGNSTDATLEVGGTASISGVTTLGSTLTVAGAATLQSTLAVTGRADFSSSASISGTFEGAGTIKATTYSGDAGVTLSAPGTNSINIDTGGAGTINIGGTGAGSLNIGRSTVVTNIVDALKVSGNSIQDSGGTARVTFSTTGATGLTSFTGFASISQALEASGAIISNSVLQAGGTSAVAYNRLGTAATTHLGSISTNNDLLISGDLEVDASAAFDGNVTIAGTLTLAGDASVSGTFEANNLIADNLLQVGGTSLVTYNRFGTAATAHGLSTNSDVLISGKLEANGDAWFGANASVAGNLEVSGIITGFTAASNASISGNLDVTGMIHASDGTAALPSYTFDLDQNTGFFRPGTDMIGFTTGGTEKMRLDTTGLAINAKGVDAGNKIEVGGSYLASGSGNVDLTLQSLDSTTTDGKFTLRSMGTSADALQILNGAGNQVYKVASSGHTYIATNNPIDGAAVTTFIGKTGFSGNILVAGSNTGAEGFSSSVLKVTNGGVVVGAATDNSGLSAVTSNFEGTMTFRTTAAAITSNGTFTFSAGNQNTNQFLFQTSAGAPATIFAINDTTATNKPTSLFSARYLGTDWFTINGSSGSVGLWDSTPDARLEIVATGSQDYLALSSTAAANGDVFMVKFGGNVGIGTNNPLAKLQVIGNASISTNFEASGYSSSSQTFGSGLSACNSVTQKLIWSATGLFSCANDQTGGGGGGGSMQVREYPGGVTVSNVATISFEPGNFNIAASGGIDALVKLDWVNGPASRANDETITGFWTFNNNASVTGTFEGSGTIKATTFSGDAAVAVLSGGNNTLRLDAGGSGVINVGDVNATAINIGRAGITTTVNGSLSGPASNLSILGNASVSGNFETTSVYQNGGTTIGSYMRTNANNLASTTNLNPGILIFGGKTGNSEYGFDLGYNATTGRFRNRAFIPTPADFAIATVAADPTAQSNFTELFTVRGDTGNVGIGNPSPDSKLDVTGNILASTSGNVDLVLNNTQQTYGKFTIRATTNPVGKLDFLEQGNSTPMLSLSSNSAQGTAVGINTATPVARLHVNTSGGGLPNSILFGQNDGVKSNMLFAIDNADTYSYIETGINSSDTTSGLRFSRYGTLTSNIANFQVYANGASFSNNFEILNGFASISQTLFVQNHGNVGIGTTNPLVALQVVGASSISSNLEVGGYASASQYFGAGLTSCATTTSKLLWASGLFSCGTDQAGTGGGKGISVREGIGTGTFSHIGSFSFDANMFAITNTASESLVRLDWGTNGVPSKSASNTWSALNLFTGGASFSTNQNNLLNIEGSVTNSGATAIAGMFASLSLQNSTTGGFNFGNRTVVNVQNTVAASGSVGEFIRMIDNTSLRNTVRGLEVQAYSGTNTTGINTAIAAFAKTIGVQATTNSLAAGTTVPAAVLADLDNGSAPTVGNALRAYTDNATSANLVQFYQEISAFTGTGLLMNFGNNAGSFTGRFMDLQKAGTSKFVIDNTGNVGIGTTTPTAFLSIASSTATVSLDFMAGGTTEKKFTFRSNLQNSDRIDILNGAGATLMTIASIGNVGIGTTIPGVAGTSSRRYLTLSGPTDGGLELVSQGADASGLVEGVIHWSDKNATGEIRTVQLRGELDGTTANNRGGTFRLYTKANNGALTEHLQVSQGGSVSIGIAESIGAVGLCHRTNGTSALDAIVDCASNPVADYMEMYPMAADVQEGDIVVANTNSHVITKDGDTLSQVALTSTPYDQNIIGIVSVASHATDFNSVGYNINDADRPLPLALNGRVKLKVSLENGPITVGDKLTTSTVPGVAMKATQAGTIVGMALEDLPAGSVASDSYTKIMSFVQVGYWAPTSSLTQVAMTSTSSISSTASPSISVSSSGGVDVLGTIASAAKVVMQKLEVMGDAIVHGARKTYFAFADALPNIDPSTWGSHTVTISSLADAATQALFTGNGAQAADQSKVDLAQDNGNYLATYGVDSTRGDIQLSGTSDLINGEAKVFFDESFTSIISANTPIRVLITPTTDTITGQLVTTTKTQFGFVVKELNGASTGKFDWLVIARRKGFDDAVIVTPAPALTAASASTTVTPPATTTATASASTPLTANPATPTASISSAATITPTASATPASAPTLTPVPTPDPALTTTASSPTPTPTPDPAPTASATPSPTL